MVNRCSSLLTSVGLVNIVDPSTLFLAVCFEKLPDTQTEQFRLSPRRTYRLGHALDVISTTHINWSQKSLPHPALFYKRIKIADRKYHGKLFGRKEVLTIHCFHALRPAHFIALCTDGDGC